MFVVIFNLLFMYYNKNYSTLFNALVTIVNAGVGNFSYVNFDSIPDIRLAIFGKLFLVALIVVFLILMLNLIIAILTNVSNTYENLSTGLFLSKILSTREQLESDEYYGAFISSTTTNTEYKLVVFFCFFIKYITLRCVSIILRNAPAS